MQEIFRYVSVFDLCAAAHVSQRFRSNALTVGRKRRHFTITNDPSIPIWKFENYLRLFGEALQSINIQFSTFGDVLMVLIIKHCTNLRGIDAELHNRYSIIKFGAFFSGLQKLRLKHNGKNDDIFRPMVQLESIELDTPFGTIAPIHLPNLTSLHVGNIEWRPARYISKCFRMNNQLKRLHLSSIGCFDVGTILKHLPNLEELCIDIESITNNWGTFECESYHVFQKLRSLQSIILIGFDWDTTNSVLDAFVACDMKVKRLTLRRSTHLEYPYETIKTMSSLEYLEIDRFNDDVEMIAIAKKCVNLKEIDIKSDQRLSLKCLEDTIKAAKVLKTVRFATDVYAYKLHDVERTLNAIAELRKRRDLDISIELDVLHDPEHDNQVSLISHAIVLVLSAELIMNSSFLVCRLLMTY